MSMLSNKEIVILNQIPLQFKTFLLHFSYFIFGKVVEEFSNKVYKNCLIYLNIPKKKKKRRETKH